MVAFSFNKNRTIHLFRGQRIRLVCGGFFTTTRRIHLNLGEFVVVKCATSNKTIVVSCGSNATRSRGTIHLKRGQSLVVSC